jgi:hypothetical protein
MLYMSLLCVFLLLSLNDLKKYFTLYLQNVIFPGLMNIMHYQFISKHILFEHDYTYLQIYIHSEIYR